MSDTADEIARLNDELAHQLATRRELYVRHFGEAHGLRPEAMKVAIALIDWEKVELEEDADWREFLVVDEIRALALEHDYLFIPELIHPFSAEGDADGGKRHHPVDDGADEKPAVERMRREYDRRDPRGHRWR